MIQAVAEKQGAPMVASDDLAPLARAKAKRRRSIMSRIDAGDKALLRVAQWCQDMPEGVRETPLVEGLEEQLRQAMYASIDAVAALRLETAETNAAGEVARMIPDEERSAKFFSDAALMRTASLALQVLAQRANALFAPIASAAASLFAATGRAAPLGRDGAPVGSVEHGPNRFTAELQMPLLQLARGMLVDMEWLTASAARLEAEGAGEARLHADRVKRYRKRKAAGFKTVTLTYHEGDLESLEAFGFLHPGSVDDEDITAAFDAFLQAALTSVLSGAELTGRPADSERHTLMFTRWMDRMIELRKVDD